MPSTRSGPVQAAERVEAAMTGARGASGVKLLRHPFATTLAWSNRPTALALARSDTSLLARARLDVHLRVVQDDRVASYGTLRGDGGDGRPVELPIVTVLDAGSGQLWALADELRLQLQLGLSHADGLPEGAESPDRARPAAADGNIAGAATDVVRRLVEQVVSEGDAQLAGEILHADLTFSRPGLGSAFACCMRAKPQGPGFAGLDGFRSGLSAIRRSFPDWRQVVRPRVAAQNGLVVAPIHVTGTHSGPLFDLPPTAAAVAFDEVLIVAVTDGRIADIWAMGDEAVFLDQLGLLKRARS